MLSQKINYTSIALFCCLCLFVHATRASGQNEDPEMFNRIQTAYNQFRYEEVVELAMEALNTVPPPSPRTRIDIYTYLAYSYIALGKTDEARQQFRDALTIDPELTLDPVYVSPKIIAVFEEVKDAYEKTNEPEGVPPEQVELISEINALTLRKEGAWRSLLLPGWGQFHKGQKRRATIFFAAHAINIGALIYTHLQTENAHDEYLNAREPSTIESEYDRYNRFYKARTYCILSTAAVWLASHIDAALSPPLSEGDVQKEDRAGTISPMIGPDSFGVTYTLHF